MKEPELHVRTEDGASLPLLVWRPGGHSDARVSAASTASAGGGLGSRAWIVNAQVAHDYSRHDLDRHAAELAAGNGLTGPGVAMFTAADVRRCERADADGLRAWVTVGLREPTWAAADEPARPPSPGTINIVVWVPAALTQAALLNALCTATEAKSQALFERGIPGTGTPSDAVTVACPADGPAEPFCGPRSAWGSRLARAVHAAVTAGIDGGQVSSTGSPTASSPGAATSA